MRKTANRCKRKKNRNDIGTVALIALFTWLFVFSGSMLVRKLLEYKEGTYKYNTIKNIAVTEPVEDKDDLYLTIDFDALHAINSDYVGWIDIPGENISFPVVYAHDYVEYIHTAIDGTYLYVGTLFTDYRCAKDFSARNTIIYGHKMKDGSMFAPLQKYLNSEYAKSHGEIDIYADGRVLVYRVFSVFLATAGDENYTVEFADDEAYLTWLKGVAARSQYTIEAELDENSRVLMLSTCNNGGDDRIVVFAVLTKTVER